MLTGYYPISIGPVDNQGKWYRTSIDDLTPTHQALREYCIHISNFTKEYIVMDINLIKRLYTSAH